MSVVSNECDKSGQQLWGESRVSASESAANQTDMWGCAKGLG